MLYTSSSFASSRLERLTGCPCRRRCRVLDDATFATLSSLMLFNNVEVLMSLTKDPRFFPELFRRLGAGPGGNLSKPDASWVDLVSFLQASAHFPLDGHVGLPD
jgi:Component of IIS longevity pathway SMK-1